MFSYHGYDALLKLNKPTSIPFAASPNAHFSVCSD